MINGEYKIEDPKRSKKKIVLLVILLLIIFGAAWSVYFFTKVNRGSSDKSAPAEVVVDKGSSTSQIAKKLAAQNIIQSPRIFVLYATYKHAAGKIQAGTYTLDARMSIVEIIDILTAGKVTRDEKKVTVIEGWNNKQLGSYLEERGITTQDKFADALKQDYDFKFASAAKQFDYEGFIFPDTYQIAKNAGADALIQEALKNFEKKLTTEMQAEMDARGLSLSDVIIMASIIEKEVGRNTSGNLSQQDVSELENERKLVSSVFYNRLKIGMMLQSDATVNYITGGNDPSVSADDLKIDSKYNTYKYAGLPPGPIGNPGEDSIMAAIYPADSDYLYFLSKPDGTAVFSKTLEEHNANKAKYLQ
jgi:UPF0755 protein